MASAEQQKWKYKSSDENSAENFGGILLNTSEIPFGKAALFYDVQMKYLQSVPIC